MKGLFKSETAPGKTICIKPNASVNLQLWSPFRYRTKIVTIIDHGLIKGHSCKYGITPGPLSDPQDIGRFVIHLAASAGIIPRATGTTSNLFIFKLRFIGFIYYF
jgi:hypothetical protein